MKYRLWIIWVTIVVSVFPVFGQNIPRSAYVVNTLGQNLSVVNLENQTVTPDALPLGLYTNQIVLHNERGYVVNSGVNEIQVIDLAPVNTIATIDVGSGTNPYAMTFVNDSLAVVSLLFTNQVAFVNVASQQVQQTLSVGTGPEGVQFAAGKIYVANTGFNGAGYDAGTVTVIDAANLTVLYHIPVATNPQDLAVDSQNRLYVACTGDYAGQTGKVMVVDSQTDQVIDSLAFQTYITSVSVSPQDKLYIGTFGSGVFVYNLTTHTFERDENNPLPGGPEVAFDAAGNAYVVDFGQDNLRVYSSNHQLLHSFAVGDGPISVAVYDPATVGIRPTTLVADRIELLENYPDPFNPGTTIQFRLPDLPLQEGTHSGHPQVQLHIFNLLGQRIATLLDQPLAPGTYQVQWDGTDSRGIPQPTGIYFYRLQVGSQAKVKSMHLIR